MKRNNVIAAVAAAVLVGGGVAAAGQANASAGQAASPPPAAVPAHDHPAEARDAARIFADLAEKNAGLSRQDLMSHSGEAVDEAARG